jgi:alanyl-tRNA synthetase
MLERLYYADAYLKTFTAQVIERLQWDGRPAVVLDRTAFYPTGGGQPHDTGTLQGIAVVDVVERETDAAVIHLLDGPLEVDQVEGQVDWDRRFDLMQQHTGQHILSAAFVERLEANTVGFHLSDEYTTIDLDRASLSADDLAAVETLANAVVLENRPVDARFVADEEVAILALRKPLAHEGPVRIVSIPDVDYSACGGTHVRATGEVGPIKITRSERRGPMARVEFLCGWRALADYQAKNAAIMDLARELTVGHWEVADAVRRLTEELKESRRELRRTRDAWLDAEATALWHEATRVGDARIVKALFAERTPDDLKHLAQRLATQEKTVALLAGGGGAGEKSHFTFARSADLDVHMGSLVRQACEVIGGRGGGRPEFAQGGGPEGRPVDLALGQVFQSLVDSMDASGEAGKANWRRLS